MKPKLIRPRPVVKLTPEGLQKLKDELAALQAKRPGVVTRLTAAREQGDLSENAGYHAAKEELGFVDSRSRALKDLIRFAQISDGSSLGVIAMGSDVTVEVEGQKKVFKVVSALEADPVNGKMSDVSPIGSALVGKKVGDNVEVETPGGKVIYKIVDIS